MIASGTLYRLSDKRLRCDRSTKEDEAEQPHSQVDSEELMMHAEPVSSVSLEPTDKSSGKRRAVEILRTVKRLMKPRGDTGRTASTCASVLPANSLVGGSV